MTKQLSDLIITTTIRFENMVMLRNITSVFLLGSACPTLGDPFAQVDESRQDHRGLLPIPPHLNRENHGYKGCLGLSVEEIKEASKFKDDMPQCEIIVHGTTVVVNTASTTSSNASSENNLSDDSIALTTTSSTAIAFVYEESATYESGADDSVGSDDASDLNYEVYNDDAGAEGNEDDMTENIEGYDETSPSSYADGSEVASTSSATLESSTVEVEGDSDEEIPNPLLLFDMSDCGTYSSLWVWDLALTCSNSTSLDNCSCTAAKIHIQYGDIDCMNDKCPKNCPVCDMCMRLTGCIPGKELLRGATTDESSIEAIPITFIGLTAAMFGIQLVLFKMYWNRRSQPSDDLRSQFIV